MLGCAPTEHEATGEVVAVDPDARTVTIRHDDIPGVMAAMTMRFPVQSAGVLAGVAPRDRVRFVLRRRGGQFVVVRMTVTAAAVPPGGETPEPGVHDHTPHHGGVVGMSGMLHLEALARADGTVRVWLSDYFRTPRPLDDVSGRVTLELPDGDRPLALRVVRDALEAVGPPIAEPEVAAHVELTVAGEPVEMDFLLPTTDARAAPGAAGVPTAGCLPVPADATQPTPRCALDFGRAIAALAATADGATLLVAAVDAGVSAWRLPAGTLLRGFEPPPPVTVPDVRLLRPHPEGANAIALRPDGREAVVALENRLLRYDVETGRLVRELPAAAGVVRAVDWSPDGESLVVTIFYDAAARLLRADTGIEWGRLPVEREAAAAAFSPDGRAVAVGDESGGLTVFPLGGGDPRVVTRGDRAVVAVRFAGERLLAGRDGGVVQIWHRDGGLGREIPTGSARARLAVAPGSGTVATTGAGTSFHLFDIASSEPPEVRGWHRREIAALAWAGRRLVTADAGGRVAVWEGPPFHSGRIGD